MRIAIYRLILKLLSLFSLPINHRIGSLIGRALYRFDNDVRRTCMQNLKLCLPELDDSHRQQLCRDTLIEMGKSVTELGPVWLWPEQRMLKLMTNTVNEQIARDAIDQGKGMILLTPHIGCWEIAGLYCATIFNITSLYRPPRLQALETFLLKARQRSGATLVPTNIHGVKALFKALANNNTVGILPDQDPSGDGGVFAPYFGINAHTIKLIPRLIQKTGAQVCIMYAERMTDGKGYTLHFKKPDDEIYSGDLPTAVAAMNRSVEACVREIPEQYQWSYKRFKTRPKGEKSLYIN